MRAKKTPTFHIRPLAAFLAAGLVSGYAAASSPFATIPLHLQKSNAVTSAGGVKPNVMLQIDDSGSMQAIVPGSGGRNRLTVVQTALRNLLNNPEFRDEVNWNMITICNSDGFWPSGYNPSDPNWRFAVTPADLITRINRMSANCATPSNERYLDALHILRSTYDNPRTYRCQKNYVVLFSDGDANGYRLQIDGDSRTGFFPSANNDTLNNRVRIGSAAGAPITTWWARGNRFRYLHPNPQVFAQYQAGINSNITDSQIVRDPATGRNVCRYTGARLGSSQLLIRRGSDYVWNNDAVISRGCSNGWYPQSIWALDARSLQYFAESVSMTDLKTGGTDAAGKSWDDPDVNGGRQTIGTFTIGFGNGLSRNGQNYLSFGATANGGQYIAADTQADLDAAFRRIFDQIKSENTSAPPTSYASIAPTTAGNNSEKVPSMAAAIQLDLTSGSSEIRFYDISGTAGSLTVDGTSYKIPDYSGRKTIIGPSATTGAAWFDTSMAANNDYFDIPAATGGANANEWRTSLVPWINRSAPDNTLNLPTNALKYRERTDTPPPSKRNMGDVVASGIVAYGPNGATEYNRQKYLITAANDGMLYLFQTSNNPNHPYSLKLNYMPGFMPRSTADDTVVRNLKHIADPDYITDSTKPHRYLLDGGFSIRTTDKNGPRQTFLAGNMGRGGRGAYAINIGGFKRSNGSQAVGIDAPESSWTSSVPLFETPKGTAADSIGYTIGTPQIGRISPDRHLGSGGAMTTNLYDVKYAVFMNSGVHSPASAANPAASESALYVYNLLANENVGLTPSSGSAPANSSTAGELLRKITVGNTGGLMQPTLLDVNFDGVVDIAYAGDYNGGMYRFDLRTGNPASWTVSKIFQAQPGQTITSAPAVARRGENQYTVIFGTGSDLYQSDLRNTNVQSVYGIYEDLTVNSPAQVAQSELLEQTMGASSSVSGANVRSLSNHALTNQKGWFFNLPAGERVVVKPELLLRTVLLTSRNYRVTSSGSTTAPAGDPCVGTTYTEQSEGEGWIMQFRADTGGILPSQSDPDPDKDLFAYVDFFNENTAKDANVRPNHIHSGYMTPSQGLADFLALTGGPDPDAVGGQGSAMGLDGTINNNGTDSPLDPSGSAPRQCFQSGNNVLIGSNSNASQGVNNPVNIYGRLCGGGIRRISWREIF